VSCRKATESFLASYCRNFVKSEMWKVVPYGNCSCDATSNKHVFNSNSGEGGGIQFGPLGTAATNRPIVPTPSDYDDGEIGGMMIGRGNRNTRRKPAPVPLCPPQTPHALPWTRTLAAAMGSERLTA
jgi:hypothetical protein